MDFRINPNINDEVIVNIEDFINLLECKLIATKKQSDVDLDWDYSEVIQELESNIERCKSLL